MKEAGYTNVDDMFPNYKGDTQYFKSGETGVAPDPIKTKIEGPMAAIDRFLEPIFPGGRTGYKDPALVGTATKGPYAGQQYNIMDEKYVDLINPETGLIDQEALLKQGSDRLDSMYENMDSSFNRSVHSNYAKSLRPEDYAKELRKGIGSPGTFDEMYPDFAFQGHSLGAPNPFAPKNYAQFQDYVGGTPAEILTSDPSSVAASFQGDVGPLPFATSREWSEIGGTPSVAGYTEAPIYGGTGTLSEGYTTPMTYDSATTNIFGFDVPISDAAPPPVVDVPC